MACLKAVLHFPTSEGVVRGPRVCIGTSEEGVVSLYNEEVGMWEYNLSGVGVRPGVMDPTRITATLGSDGSSFVSWRNPFVDPVKVSLAYALAGLCPCFCLCLGRCIWVPWALLTPAFGLASAFVVALVPLTSLAVLSSLPLSLQLHAFGSTGTCLWLCLCICLCI